jgi:CcmD family protein
VSAWSRPPRPDGRKEDPLFPLSTDDTAVLLVSLLVWGLLFFYVVRLERRIKDLEKR